MMMMRSTEEMRRWRDELFMFAIAQRRHVALCGSRARRRARAKECARRGCRQCLPPPRRKRHVMARRGSFVTGDVYCEAKPSTNAARPW